LEAAAAPERGATQTARTNGSDRSNDGRSKSRMIEGPGRHLQRFERRPAAQPLAPPRRLFR
jgi:hypothetical protein